MFFKIAAQKFEAGDFLDIFLRFLGFPGSFSYENFSYKKNRLNKFCQCWVVDVLLSSIAH